MKIPQPPSKEEITALAPFAGLGLANIVVVTTAQEARAAGAELARHTAVGFDTEARPTFMKYQKSEGPHVLQFATLEQAYIFQAHVRESHEALMEVLASPAIAKIGFGLANDLTHIHSRFGVTPRAIVDLNRTFKDLGYKNSVGARSAIAIFFNQRLAKSKSITTSNWSTAQLSEKQILYAANDAYAAIRVFHALEQRAQALARTPAHRR